MCIEPDGNRAAITATIFDDLAAPPVTRIALLDLDTGELETIAAHQNSDRLPRWSPDGRWLAYLSDRREAGNYQLCLAKVARPSNPVEPPSVNGSVEYLHWSPDGSKVLLGVAGRGADLAGCQGGTRVAATADDLPEWMPDVDTGDADNLWRSLYVYDIGSGRMQKVSLHGLNCVGREAGLPC